MNAKMNYAIRTKITTLHPQILNGLAQGEYFSQIEGEVTVI